MFFAAPPKRREEKAALPEIRKQLHTEELRTVWRGGEKQHHPKEGMMRQQPPKRRKQQHPEAGEEGSTTQGGEGKLHHTPKRRREDISTIPKREEKQHRLHKGGEGSTTQRGCVHPSCGRMLLSPFPLPPCERCSPLLGWWSCFLPSSHSVVVLSSLFLFGWCYFFLSFSPLLMTQWTSGTLCLFVES